MSFSVAAVILVITFLIVHPVFMTIDDARLRYVYAGYATGTPTSLYLFCYYPLSAIVSTLYSWAPAIPWYALYQFGSIGLASGIIGKTIYKICNRNKIHWVFAILFHSVFYFVTCLISTILMHFEITAAMLGSAGVACFLAMDIRKDSRAVQIVDYIVSASCMIGCFIIQYNAFYSICCYLLVVIAVKIAMVFKGNRKALKNSVIMIGCIAVLVVAVKLQDNYLKSSDSWQEYLEYNKYRVSFWDYPHTNYEEDPELFESIGWSEEFYELSDSMYFMDSRFNKDNLAAFTTRFSWFSNDGPEAMKENLQDEMKNLFRTERLPIIHVFIMGGFLVWTGVLLIRKKWHILSPQILGLLFDVFGTAILVLVLGARGRLPLRAWLMSLIPAITVGMLLLLMTLKPFRMKKKSRILAAVLGTVIPIVLVLGGYWAYRKVMSQDRSWRIQRSNNVRLMERYIISHPENVYVYDYMGCQNYSVFSSYPDSESGPSNGFAWGSSYLYTPAYFDQLRENRLKSLYTEDLLRDNVYFIASVEKNMKYKNLLEAMLKKDYPGTEMEAVDSIGDAFIVFKVSEGAAE